jgi:hypothetical protein
VCFLLTRNFELLTRNFELLISKFRVTNSKFRLYNSKFHLNSRYFLPYVAVSHWQSTFVFNRTLQLDQIVHTDRTYSYGGTKVTCVCFYLSCAHKILCRGHELLSRGQDIVKSLPRATMSCLSPNWRIGRIYGGTKVTCVCFYLSAHELLCRSHELLIPIL